MQLTQIQYKYAAYQDLNTNIFAIIAPTTGVKNILSEFVSPSNYAGLKLQGNVLPVVGKQMCVYCSILNLLWSLIVDDEYDVSTRHLNLGTQRTGYFGYMSLLKWTVSENTTTNHEIF